LDAGWASEPFWMWRIEKISFLSPAGNRTPIVQPEVQTLYWLSYLGSPIWPYTILFQHSKIQWVKNKVDDDHHYSDMMLHHNISARSSFPVHVYSHFTYLFLIDVCDLGCTASGWLYSATIVVVFFFLNVSCNLCVRM
jgi:hypothetical protein